MQFSGKICCGDCRHCRVLSCQVFVCNFWSTAAQGLLFFCVIFCLILGLSELGAPFPGMLPVYGHLRRRSRLGSRLWARLLGWLPGFGSTPELAPLVLGRLLGWRPGLAPGLAPGFWPCCRVGSQVLAEVPSWLPGLGSNSLILDSIFRCLAP